MNSAVFVDFENLFASLEGRRELGRHRPRDAALTILENLKGRLQVDAMPMVLGRSYAAFDTYPGMEVAHDLALMGFDPLYALAQPSGRNSANVQIAVDVCRVLFRRPDIEMIVIVAGDGDFIPVARQVLEENRGLRVVALPDTASGNLRLRVGADRFLSAFEFFPGAATVAAAGAERPAAARDLDQGSPAEACAVTATANGEAGDGGSASAEQLRPGAAIVGHIPVTWTGSSDKAVDLEPALQQQLAACLDLIVKAQVRHGSQEIWLSPFLKGPLTQHFSRLVHPQRRALINELRNRDAIRVEVRENQFADHPYSVIVLQEQHPWVIAAVERNRRP